MLLRNANWPLEMWYLAGCMTEIIEGRGFKHESGADCLKLDLTHLGSDHIKNRLTGIREIGIKFSGVDIIDQPIEIRPVCHYMMGGIHTDIDGATQMKDSGLRGNDMQ